MDHNEIYSEILKRVSYSEENVAQLNDAKQKLVDLVSGSFSRFPNYVGFKFIGSTVSGDTLRWKKDIDGIVMLTPYERDTFRSGVSSMECEFIGIKFTRNCKLVRDHFSGFYGGFEVGIGAVDGRADPKKTLEGDILMHPDFAASHLSQDQRQDVRLAKLFFYNCGVYGRMMGGSFSIQQLIAHFGSFDNFLRDLSKGNPIFVDFSGRYNGEKSPFVVTYPYCGLENMAAGVKEKEFDKLVSYARRLVARPEQFLEDSLLTLNHEFWKKRAERYGDSEEFSFPDVYLNKRENRAIKRVVQRAKPSRILDIGCGNGFSTFDIVSGLESSIIGIDSNEIAVQVANRMAVGHGRKGVSFMVGQMEDISFPDKSFDMVYAKRALTNLPTRSLQRRSLEECSRVLTSNGLFCVSDLFSEGYDKLNKMRAKVGLPCIDLPNHAYLFTESDLLQMTQDLFALQNSYDDTSTYYFTSRIIHPLIAKVLGFDVKSDSRINLIASKLPSPEFLGLNKLYVFKKNG